MNPIKFGTDGWRALIARDFTFDRVALVSKAALKVIKNQNPSRNQMIVGYDRRFLSQAFAKTAACVYAQEGVEVLFAETAIPTPALSWCAKNFPKALGATVITASHNPPEWNGFKFKEAFGGSALPKTTKAFEQTIEKLSSENVKAPPLKDFERFIKKGKINVFNLLPNYLEALKALLDVDRIRKADFTVGLDTMHGAATQHYKELLESVGVKTISLHEEENPGFRGVPPEPIGKNLPELCELTKKEKWACGLATDGDADRLGAVDELGEYFSTQKILSVVYWHMLRNRNKKWSISRSASTTRMVDLIAKSAGVSCIETPVGFKFIAEKMLAGEAQIGGEESGGIGIIDHIPERDGLLTGLLLLELMATEGKGLHAVYEDLCKEQRPYQFVRLDLHVSKEIMDQSMKRLQENPPNQWDGRAVETLSQIDGFKFYLKDGSWLLIRPSGTEPIFRLYAETESMEASEKLVRVAQKFVQSEKV